MSKLPTHCRVLCSLCGSESIVRASGVLAGCSECGGPLAPPGAAGRRANGRRARGDREHSDGSVQAQTVLSTPVYAVVCALGKPSTVIRGMVERQVAALLAAGGLDGDSGTESD